MRQTTLDAFAGFSVFVLGMALLVYFATIGQPVLGLVLFVASSILGLLLIHMSRWL